jgi:hypothetical protein
MSAEPEKSPAFDLDAVSQRYYNHEAVAEEVVWPLVDMYWRGDWRQESQEGCRLTIKRESRRQKQIFDTCLSAYNLLEDGDGNDDDGFLVVRSVAMIAVESIVRSGAKRNWIRAQAARQGFKVSEKRQDVDKVFLIGTAYSFDTDYNLSISTSHIIEDIAGRVMWHARALRGDADLWHPTSYDDPVDAEAVEDTEGPRLFSPDMFMLQKAVDVLGDTEICAALHDIKKNPVVGNSKGRVS